METRDADGWRSPSRLCRSGFNENNGGMCIKMAIPAIDARHFKNTLASIFLTAGVQSRARSLLFIQLDRGAGIAVLTGAINWCPMHAIKGSNTCKLRQMETAAGRDL